MWEADAKSLFFSRKMPAGTIDALLSGQLRSNSNPDASVEGAIDVTQCVCVRSSQVEASSSAQTDMPQRRRTPLRVHLTVAQHVPRAQAQHVPLAPTFDGSALRDIVVAARNGTREQVHALGSTLKAAIASHGNSHLAAMARTALNNALCTACDAAHVRIVRELLDAGADAAAISTEGLSPLEHAVASRSLLCVRALLQHGKMHETRQRRCYRGWRSSAALARAVELSLEPIAVEMLDAGVVVTRAVILAAAPPHKDVEPPRGAHDWLPVLITAVCTSPDVDVRGLRVQAALESLCRRDTTHNRTVYQRVRRYLLTHILQMTTAELVEMQVRSLRANPFDGFSDVVFVAKAFIGESNAAVKANDRLSGDELGQMAMRVQVVCAGCLHLLALSNAPTLLAFLHSRRAQIILCEAADRSSPSEPLDGSCTVLISSREVQHIYQQRWRGTTGFAARAAWKARMYARMMMPVYCAVATLYPPLDVTRLVPAALFRYAVPSPRLKFAMHAVADAGLAVLLMLAHLYFGSLRRIQDIDARDGLDLPTGCVVYLMLAAWVLTIILSEVLHCWRASKREYVSLLDLMSNPSVYHARLKHKLDDTKVAFAEPHSKAQTHPSLPHL